MQIPLISFDLHDVVRVLVFHQVTGGLHFGMESTDGDDRIRDIQRVQEILDLGDVVGLFSHGHLPDHAPFLVD